MGQGKMVLYKKAAASLDDVAKRHFTSPGQPLAGSTFVC